MKIINAAVDSLARTLFMYLASWNATLYRWKQQISMFDELPERKNKINK